MPTKLVSFDVTGRFAFFKKPEINAGISFTYGFIHRPALLGLLGAVAGLGGYSQAFSHKKKAEPDYYVQFSGLPVAIAPLSNDAIHRKVFITYTNTAGYANSDGNLIVKEQTILNPQYRIFMQLDTGIEVHQKLEKYLTENKSEYIPYLGKNEFQAEITNLQYYNDAVINPQDLADGYQILSLFTKPDKTLVKESGSRPAFSLSSMLNDGGKMARVYFERLPVTYSDQTNNYELKEFVYSEMKFSRNFRPPNLVKLYSEKEEYIQLIDG